MDIERRTAGSEIVLPAGMEIAVPPPAGDLSGGEPEPRPVSAQQHAERAPRAQSGEERAAPGA